MRAAWFAVGTRGCDCANQVGKLKTAPPRGRFTSRKDQRKTYSAACSAGTSISSLNWPAMAAANFV